MSTQTDERVDLEAWMTDEVKCFVDERPARWYLTLRCANTESRPMCDVCHTRILSGEQAVINQGGGCDPHHMHRYTDNPRLLSVRPL